MKLSQLSARNRRLIDARSTPPALPSDWSVSSHPRDRRMARLAKPRTSAPRSLRASGPPVHEAILDTLLDAARAGAPAPYRRTFAERLGVTASAVDFAWLTLRDRGLIVTERLTFSSREYVVRLATGEVLRTPGMPPDIMP